MKNDRIVVSEPDWENAGLIRWLVHRIEKLLCGTWEKVSEDRHAYSLILQYLVWLLFLYRAAQKS